MVYSWYSTDGSEGLLDEVLDGLNRQRICCRAPTVTRGAIYDGFGTGRCSDERVYKTNRGRYPSIRNRIFQTFDWCLLADTTLRAAREQSVSDGKYRTSGLTCDT